MDLIYTKIVKLRAKKTTLYHDIRTYKTHIEFNRIEGCLISIILFLRDYGIKIRSDDGILFHITISETLRIRNVLFFGLRYLKRDGSETEDLYRLNSDGSFRLIDSGYKCKIKEYKNSHKVSVIKDIDYKNKLIERYKKRVGVYSHEVFDKSYTNFFK